MLHDNFDDPKWKRGDPLRGTLIFTDQPEPQAEPLYGTDTQLSALEERVKELEKKARNV